MAGTMASSVPTQIAETIQTAHIQRNPSPRHDLNPTSSISEKQPVQLHEVPRQQQQQQRQRRRHRSSRSSRSHQRHEDDTDYDGELDEIDEAEEDRDSDDYLYDDEDDEIPVSVLRARPRAKSFPPMPDLRFEQSYLHSIAKADTWWKVLWITARDQMMMPLAQGVVYNLAICGWHHWNKNAQLSGTSVGARVRRWWYGVNNWPLPEKQKLGGADYRARVLR
ncbi:DUF1770-domain-containing protein [Hypoxylon sp. NC1633]|nr:DUF1770-domain-containing protein [Hypoxylon sp. NC1633]